MSIIFLIAIKLTSKVVYQWFVNFNHCNILMNGNVNK